MLSKTQVKYIQSLGQKKFRDQDDVFIAEGPKIISELLNDTSWNIVQVYGVSDWIKKSTYSEHLTEISSSDLDKISQLTTPNEVLAVVQKKRWEGEMILSGQLSLALDGIRDPGNLGTMIRLADWFGISNILCSTDCVDLYNPKVIQASMGSFLRVRLESFNLESRLKETGGVKIYAAALEGKPLSAISRINEGIILIGNESNGISSSLQALAHESITIVRKGKAESLNAAIAAGIILSHIT